MLGVEAACATAVECYGIYSQIESRPACFYDGSVQDSESGAVLTASDYSCLSG